MTSSTDHDPQGPQGPLPAAPCADQPPDPYGLPPVLTVDEAAEFLRVSAKTVYAAVKAKELPGRRVGKRVVFLRDALLEWMQCNGSAGSRRRKRRR